MYDPSSLRMGCPRAAVLSKKRPPDMTVYIMFSFMQVGPSALREMC